MMLRTVLLAFTVGQIALTAQVLAATAETYTNVRYGYAISYPPALLDPQPESDSGDGRVFTAKSGTAEILVYGGYNVTDQTPESLARDAEVDCPKHHATYRVAKPTLVAISCATPAGILYRMTILHEDTLITLSAKYPAAERSRWDSVVSDMAKSMRHVRVEYER